MVRRFIIALLLLLMGAPAFASSLGINWSALKPGQYQVFRTSEGARLIHRYAGPVGGLYLFEVFFGGIQTGEPMEKVFLDANGQFVKTVFESGETKLFQPHDCSRTLGLCTYSMQLANGSTHSFTQETTSTGNGFRFVRRDSNGRIVLRGSVELNNAGLTRNMTLKSPFGRPGFIREVDFVQ